MKTVLFAPMYLDGHDDRGNERLFRNIRYVQYYRQLKEHLGFDHFYFSDNASSMQNRTTFGQVLNLREEKDVTVLGHMNHLSRGRGYDYPYCWRALYTMRELILKEGVTKIITIDTDGIIVSSRLTSHIKSIQSGWEAFWCAKYNFPEAALHVMCQDYFDIFLEFTSGSFYEHNGQMMETYLPFTKVNKNFFTDRYGEDRVPQQPEFDYYGQSPNDLELIFR